MVVGILEMTYKYKLQGCYMKKIMFFEDNYRQIELLPLNLTNQRTKDYSLKALQIPINIFNARIAQSLTKFDIVETEFGFTEELIAYGTEHVNLFYETDENFICTAWLTLDIYNDSDLKCAKELLISLNSLGDLFLVDYGWDIKLSINNINEINKYLLDRKKMFSSLC